MLKPANVQKQNFKGGCLMFKRKTALYLTVIALFLAAWLFMGASCSVSSANIKNPVMTTAIDENYKPVDNVTQFALNSNPFFSAELHNAPDDTKITVVWYYEGKELDRVSFDNQGQTETMISSSMPPQMVTQTGNYSVKAFIDDREKPDVEASFTVK